VLSKKLRGLIVVLTLSVLAIGLAPAQEMTSGGATVPTLKQQLRFGLLARTPHEREFIDEVVEKVDNGDLPRSLVNSTFLWARRKQPYPMPYFEQALRVRAKLAGIDL
jgi:hypothetical protein